MPEALELGVRGRERRRMAVAEADDGDPGGKVEVAPPIGVGQPEAVTLDEQLLVVQPQQVQDRRVPVGHAHPALDRGEA